MSQSIKDDPQLLFSHKYLNYEYKNYYLYQNNNQKHIYAIDYSRCSKYLCKLSKNSEDFMQMLPYLLDKRNILEEYALCYFNYALKDNTYDESYAIKLLSAIDSHIKKLHPIFHDEISRLTFIRSCLTEYCVDSYIMWKKEIISDEENNCNENYISDEKVKNFIFRLFTPLYSILTQLDAEEMTKVINSLWHYNIQKRIKVHYSLSIDFFQLKDMSDIISDYFSVMQISNTAYPTATSSQLSALFLINNAYFIEELGHCHIYHREEIIYKIYSSYIPQKYPAPSSVTKNKTSPIFVGLESEAIAHYSDHLATTLEESFDSKNFKDEIVKQLDYYIPPRLISDDLCAVKFESLNQLIALSFSDILQKHVFIQKCHAVNCTCYFITNGKKIKYCQAHRNINEYQKNYTRNIIPTNPEFGKIFKKYDNSLYQRVHRKQNNSELQKAFSNWEVDAYELNHQINDNQIKINTPENYTIELNNLCQKHNLKPIRSYKPSSKK